MNTVTEAQLSDYFKHHAVTRLCVKEVSSGGYQVVVNLAWKKGDWTLITTRKTVREWTSLDRLVRHIREQYGVSPEIGLHAVFEIGAHKPQLRRVSDE